MKTNPTGIRFEIEDLEFIKKRENLGTPQKVVSFLMDNYIKLYKVEKKSVFEIKVFDKVVDEKLPNISLSPTDYKPAEFDHYQNPVDPFEYHKNKLTQSDSFEELKTNVGLMKKDSAIMWKQRTALESIAAQIQQEKGFIFND